MVQIYLAYCCLKFNPAEQALNIFLMEYHLEVDEVLVFCYDTNRWFSAAITIVQLVSLETVNLVLEEPIIVGRSFLGSHNSFPHTLFYTSIKSYNNQILTIHYKQWYDGYLFQPASSSTTSFDNQYQVIQPHHCQSDTLKIQGFYY